MKRPFSRLTGAQWRLLQRLSDPTTPLDCRGTTLRTAGILCRLGFAQESRFRRFSRTPEGTDAVRHLAGSDTMAMQRARQRVLDMRASHAEVLALIMAHTGVESIEQLFPDEADALTWLACWEPHTVRAILRALCEGRRR